MHRLLLWDLGCDPAWHRGLDKDSSPVEWLSKAAVSTVTNFLGRKKKQKRDFSLK